MPCLRKSLVFACSRKIYSADSGTVASIAAVIGADRSVSDESLRMFSANCRLRAQQSFEPGLRLNGFCIQPAQERFRGFGMASIASCALAAY